MFEAMKDYVPFTEVNDPQILVHPNLPGFVPIEEIGINLKRVHKLMQIGGISSLGIVGKNDGEVSSSTPMIVGVNSQGGAYAGKGGKKTMVPMQSSLDAENTDGIKRLTMEFRWRHGSILLNNNEINQHIRDNKKFGDVRSPKAWSYYLDQSVKEGIGKIGTKQLVLDWSLWDAIVHSLYYTWPIMIYQQSISYENYLYGYFLTKGYQVILNNSYNACRQDRFGYRNSLFFGPQIDRALLLKAVTRTSTLVRALS